MTIGRNLPQQITHWTSTPGGFAGYTFGTPVLIGGKWEDKAVLFRDQEGREVVSNAVVYLDTDVDVEDYIYLGDGTATADPTALKGSARVAQFHKTPDLRAVEYERKAFV